MVCNSRVHVNDCDIPVSNATFNTGDGCSKLCKAARNECSSGTESFTSASMARVSACSTASKPMLSPPAAPTWLVERSISDSCWTYTRAIRSNDRFVGSKFNNKSPHIKSNSSNVTRSLLSYEKEPTTFPLFFRWFVFS